MLYGFKGGHLENPTKVDQISLLQEAMKLPLKVSIVTQDFYDHIAVPDPLTCYVIEGAPDKRMYYGTKLVIPETPKNRYFLGQEKNDEWIMYANEDGRLINICRYEDPEAALMALNIYNMIGSHHDLNVQLYNILIAYINNDNNINSTIIGIITLFGYREDPKLQDLIQTTVALRLDDFEQRKRFDQPTKIAFDSLVKTKRNHLFDFYIKIYKIIEKNDYFIKERGMKGNDVRFDLKEPIDDIFKAMGFM